MMAKESLGEKATNYFAGLTVIFVMTFALTYHGWINGATDIVKHADWASRLDRHIFQYMSDYISYPLWHFTVKVIYKILGFDLGIAAAMATALFNCAAGGGILWAWNYLGDKLPTSRIRTIWMVFALLMGPLYVPKFSGQYYYLGQGTGNTWHNPTQFAVKGIAIVCFVLIVRLTDSERNHSKWEYGVLSALLFLSALAKPSFLQAMIPGLGLYFVLQMLCTGIKKNIVRFCCIAATFIPGVILVGWQAIINFETDTAVHNADGIGISFGEVLSEWSDNFLCSALLALAFPLFVLLIDIGKLIRDRSVQIAFCYGLSAWLEMAFLYEKGDRKIHGNWMWGWNLALFVIWTLFIIKIFDILQDEGVQAKKRRVGLYLGMPLLFFHVLFGIGFFVNQLCPFISIR